MNLFEHHLEQTIERSAPLADRLRPRSLDEYLGQDHIVGPGKVLRNALEKDEIPSMILWGPPGTGKTTLARIIARMTKSRFVPFSAVQGGIKDVREIVAQAREARTYGQGRTVLFVDEIHRFNKGQQDAFLPHVENGTIILIGATTENPSFEVNSALLSRCRVFVLHALEPKDIITLLTHAIHDKERGFGHLSIEADEEVLSFLAMLANGDGRSALNALELAVQASRAKGGKIILDKKTIEESLQRTHILYDKGGEEHYNIISALHKSMRGNDVDAALYWLGRMLEGGEDPLYIARRLVRFASEDVGLADPQALPQAVAAYQASHFIGMPECGVVLAQCVAYLARAPKSIAVYSAYSDVQRMIREHPTDPVPLHIRNAPTRLMKDLGYGKGYKYTPAFEHPEDAAQSFLPERLEGTHFFDPTGL